MKRPKLVDLVELAGELSDAMAFIETAVLSLDAHEGRGGPELHVLEHGLKELERVHAALDGAS